MDIVIRTIEEKDNYIISSLIKSVFVEFHIDSPGTVYTDPATDHLYEIFKTPKSVYWIAADDGIIIGGCGIYPTKDLPDACSELVKFYLSPKARGKGIGTMLMQRCFESAKDFGYSQIYLESFPELGQAVGMYEKVGFRHLTQALGNSGHFACSIWMIKDL
jgi:putative acetyltransferase